MKKNMRINMKIAGQAISSSVVKVIDFSES